MVALCLSPKRLGVEAGAGAVADGCWLPNKLVVELGAGAGADGLANKFGALLLPVDVEVEVG